MKMRVMVCADLQGTGSEDERPEGRPLECNELRIRKEWDKEAYCLFLSELSPMNSPVPGI